MQVKVITKKEFRDLRAVKVLRSYGHKFRLARKCPEGYHLFTDEIPGYEWISYRLKTGQKLWHKWGK